MKVKLIFNCGGTEDAVLSEDFKWVIDGHYNANDTLDLITWCSIGNIKISFDKPEDKKFFEKNLREDIKNYDYYLKAGKEFLRGMRACKTT